jgi:hypothetical protein
MAKLRADPERYKLYKEKRARKERERRARFSEEERETHLSKLKAYYKFRKVKEMADPVLRAAALEADKKNNAKQRAKLVASPPALEAYRNTKKDYMTR